MRVLKGGSPATHGHATSTGTIAKYSMSEFDEVLARDKVPGRGNNSHDSGNPSFYGTTSYDESEELRKYGDTKSMDKIAKAKKQADKAFITQGGKAIKHFNDIAGFQPIVANAIIGLPKSMINAKRVPRKIRTVQVLINTSVPGGVNGSHIIERGAYMLAMIDVLERSGYRCEVYAGKVSWVSSLHQSVGYLVKLKEASAQLSIKKLAYYLVSPSSNRRTGFAINENEPLIPDITDAGYGSGADTDKVRACLRELALGENTVIIDAGNVLDPSDSEENKVEHMKSAFAKAAPELGWVHYDTNDGDEN